jgi:adenosylcobinamide-phosphate synthase
MLTYSLAAFAIGFGLDLLFGDPHGFPHIVVSMGKLISGLERVLRRCLPKTDCGERRGGLLLVIFMLAICTGLPLFILILAYKYSSWLGMALEALLIYQLLAAKSLRKESSKVYEHLIASDIGNARQALSMIVGRDTEKLDEEGITKAVVETVAENTSDGVIAPLLYITMGGAVLGCLYKAVNTMDSMVGYKSSKYINFGRAAARLDDALNFVPARLAAQLMIAATYICGMDVENAKRVYLRDRRNHASPNSAQTEAVVAGALGVQLAGDAHYFGKLHTKPFIGDGLRAIEPEDIPRTNRLMYTATFLMLIFSILVRIIFVGGGVLAGLYPWW